MGDREWFVSYDVTARSIVLQKAGEDPHQITGDEAMALREDLLAASVAASEHRVLLGGDEPGAGAGARHTATRREPAGPPTRAIGVCEGSGSSPQPAPPSEGRPGRPK